jgi:hypothetical protein
LSHRGKASLYGAGRRDSSGLVAQKGLPTLRGRYAREQSPVGEIAGDRPFQMMNAVEGAAADRLTSNQGEPALDQVEPRGAGRGEVQMRFPSFLGWDLLGAFVWCSAMITIGHFVEHQLERVGHVAHTVARR